MARSALPLLETGDVLDIASGDGVLAELLAPHAHRYVSVDSSKRVVAAAAERLRRFRNVEGLEGDMHALPFGDAEFDLVVLMHALTYADKPAQAVADAARVLRPGGRLLLSSLARHEHQNVVQAYGHANLGFADKDLRRFASRAGLELVNAETVTREKRPPHFEVISMIARTPSPPPRPASHLHPPANHESAPSPPMNTLPWLHPERVALLEAALRERILVIDGAMGTMIQRHELQEADYRGERFVDGYDRAHHPAHDGHGAHCGHDLKSNNDLLLLTRPDIIAGIHTEYLEAGADLVETNTFNSTSVSQADYHLEHLVHELNREGARIARECCDAVEATTPGKPRFVIGVLGPTSRTASISPDVNDP